MFNFFKSNKIAKLRKKLRDPKWVRSEYTRLINSYSWNIDRFEKFDCSVFFKGKELARLNSGILKQRKIKYYRRLNFLINILMEVDTKYYETYIGELTPKDKIRLNRNSIIDEIIK